CSEPTVMILFYSTDKVGSKQSNCITTTIRLSSSCKLINILYNSIYRSLNSNFLFLALLHYILSFKLIIRRSSATMLFRLGMIPVLTIITAVVKVWLTSSESLSLNSKLLQTKFEDKKSLYIQKVGKSINS